MRHTTDSASVGVSVGAAQESAESLVQAFGIRAEHLSRIAALGNSSLASPERLVEDFYGWLQHQPWMSQFFAGGVPERVRSAQVEYWRRFLAGRVDHAYVAERIAVGATHARIELPPKAYTTAMAFSLQWLTSAAREGGLGGQELLDTQASVALLCQLDTALVMDAYADHSARRVRVEASRSRAVNQEVQRVMEAAGEGDLQVRYQSQTDDDDRLAGAVNQMVEGFANTIRQARAIAAGDYSTGVAPRSDKDELGIVLAEMTRKLREVTERTERDQQLKQGQADVFERMRGELDTEVLGRHVLAYLSKRLQAPVASLYVPDDGAGLALAATYGCRAEALPQTLALGEGLVGEVALEQTPVYDLDVSACPVRGFHGLGELLLPNVAIVPLVVDGQLQGVMQFACASPPGDDEQELFQLVRENIAIGLSSALSRVRMKALLSRSQSQSEELQAQAEELRATNEDLEARTRALTDARRELEEQNRILEEKQAAVDKARTELEQRAAELSQASQYKSEFLANMSHELRTPLNSMLILSGGLCENPDGNLSERQLEALRVIHGGGQDLLTLINDILDLSKVEAGKLSVNFEQVTVRDMLRNLQRQFTPVAQQQGLGFELVTESGVPSTLSSDQKRIEQVLKNLLSNAFKFTASGSVTLEVAPRSLAEGQPAVAFSVSDTGVGIPADEQRAIFEAFQQGDGSISRTFGGTGLGLTISRELAGLLGGDLGLESAAGRGSRFTLTLPAAVTGEEVSSAGNDASAIAREPALAFCAVAPAQARQSLVVANQTQSDGASSDSDAAPLLLVVEDDPRFANELLDLVRDRGYEGVATPSGREALLLAMERRPSGIVLDMSLPDMDGMEVLDQLKFNLETRAIPVHIISGHEREQEALQKGAVAYLQKPVEPLQLQRMFERFERHWARRLRRILIVEDDQGSREAVEGLVAAKSLHVDAVATASEGLERVSEECYDCLIVDLGLPDMDGVEFLRRLPDDHPPIVVYTGREISDDQLDEVAKHTGQVVIKGAGAPDRLIDEVSLFLHQVDEQLSESQLSTLRRLHDPRSLLDGRRVLVVDDDMRNAFAMTELLQRHGLHVTKAKNGQVALDRMADDPSIELVIMDIMMPVMDGYEATRRIRAQEHLAELPIIALTAKTLPEDRQACLDAGASDYLTKPMDPDNLLALIRVLLFHCRGQDAAAGQA